MEPTNETKSEVATATKKPTDYWMLASKNFTQISYLGIFLVVVGGIIVFKKMGPYQLLTPLVFIESFLFIVVWFSLGQMFKKHHVSAVLFGNVFMALFSLNALYNRNIVGLVIAIYFFWLIQKAGSTQQA